MVESQEYVTKVSPESPYTPTQDSEGRTLVNYWEQYESPGGIKFDSRRGTDQKTLQQRGEAIDEMYSIVMEAEPEATKQIESAVSYGKMASDLVEHTENPQLKADVGRVWVQQLVNEGDYGVAASALDYIGSENANIPEMHNADYFADLYKQARDNGADFQARRVAEVVVKAENDGTIDEIFRNPSEHDSSKLGWKERERTLFEKEVQEVVDSAKKAGPQELEAMYSDIVTTFQGWRFREDGFYSDEPHPLAQESARVYIDFLSGRGDVDQAYTVALEAKLPEDDLQQIEQHMPKLQAFKQRASRHFDRLKNQVSK